MKDDKLLLEGIYSMTEKTSEILEKADKIIVACNERMLELDEKIDYIDKKCDKIIYRSGITYEQAVILMAGSRDELKKETAALLEIIKYVYHYLDKDIKPKIDRNLSISEGFLEKSNKRLFQKIVDFISQFLKNKNNENE